MLQSGCMCNVIQMFRVYMGLIEALVPVEKMYVRAWQANDPPNAHLGSFSTILKPTFNQNRGITMRCINYPGITLVGPDLQAPIYRSSQQCLLLYLIHH